MRRRFLRGGLEGFADHEVLELMLFYAIPRRNTNDLAHRLLDRYGSLSAVLGADPEDLARTKDVGSGAAALLHLFLEAARRYNLDCAGERPLLNSSSKLGAYARGPVPGPKVRGDLPAVPGPAADG